MKTSQNSIINCRAAICLVGIVLLGSLISTNAVAKVPTQKHPAITIKKGMSYLKARNMLLKAGWKLPSLPIDGYQVGDDKVTSECYGDAKLCNDLPEIQACSGTGLGQCRMVFNSTRYQLTVFTVGDIDLWRNTSRKQGYPSANAWILKRKK